MPYRVDTADAGLAPSGHEGLHPWSAGRIGAPVLEAGSEPIDPALYSRAEAPMGAVRT